LTANHNTEYVNSNTSGALSFVILSSRLLHCNSSWTHCHLECHCWHCEHCYEKISLSNFATNEICIYFDTV